ncbi:MAG: hypothetical protein EA375_04295 [Acholeplasmataceae bacterium]|nr:MAG: hypothetical protein EA375_04295 [Acholeplasmataceae bacterium]
MVEHIEKRISVRHYRRMKIEDTVLSRIQEIMQQVHQNKGPFGHGIKLSYHHSPYIEEQTRIKIGTYGFVKNAPAYIAGITHDRFENLVDFGYLMESLILELTGLGLGTVWLAGTFNRKAFDVLLRKGEIVPAITAVGYPAGKQTAREKMTRRLSRADRRLPFETLFHLNDFNRPLAPDTPELMPIYQSLELVRIGPSASNKQPWRALVQYPDVHLYLKRNPKYGKVLSFDLQALDIGIAIYHFEQGLIGKGVTYKIEQTQAPTHPDLTYVTSFKIGKNP